MGGVEKCVDCGAEIPNVKAPIPEISGSIVCADCAKEQGLPTWNDLFGGI